MQSKPKVEIVNGTIYVHPTAQHKETIIWLHGLGDSGHGFLDFFGSGVLQPPTSKVVLPTAPVRKVTINMGFESTSWFDICGFSINPANFSSSISLDEVDQSTKIINALIEQEVKLLGGDYTRIVLGGFSQGACMTLHCGLQHTERLGALIALSGFFFPTTTVNPKNADTPLLISHGDQDLVINWQMASLSYERLRAKESERKMFILNVEKNTGHEVPHNVLFLIKELLTNAIQ